MDSIGHLLELKGGWVLVSLGLNYDGAGLLCFQDPPTAHRLFYKPHCCHQCVSYRVHACFKNPLNVLAPPRSPHLALFFFLSHIGSAEILKAILFVFRKEDTWT